MDNNDQEIAPLIEDNKQSEDNLNVKIDIPTEVEDDLEPGPDCCIYKVPKRMRIADAEAYTPQLISIGPLHHGHQQLARMERQKLRYYKKFSERTSKETLGEFSSFIQTKIKQICRCYDFEFLFKKEVETSKFTKMILYDAVFIIEFFLRKYEKEPSDFLLSKKWLRIELFNDLVLLENQLPFFVLEHLYNLAFIPSSKPSFFQLTCSYFKISESEISGKSRPKHFTDLMRSKLLVNVSPPNSDKSFKQVYSATMLHEAGVKFKDARSSTNLLGITFDKGVLQIPGFYVNSQTNTISRNLMAFEQCHDPEHAYFCSYVQLLDYLINTDKDVDILVKKKIINNEMGSSQAVGDMINKLMVGVVNRPLWFGKIGNDLNKYYESSWNRRKATLKHVYFKNLWRGTATVAAFIVVVLTLVQTILAILDRAKPTN